jgi:hypothetical protein
MGINKLQKQNKMNQLNYSQKYNQVSGAWRINVKTNEEKQEEILTKIKNFLKL